MPDPILTTASGIEVATGVIIIWSDLTQFITESTRNRYLRALTFTFFTMYPASYGSCIKFQRTFAFPSSAFAIYLLEVKRQLSGTHSCVGSADAIRIVVFKTCLYVIRYDEVRLHTSIISCHSVVGVMSFSSFHRSNIINAVLALITWPRESFFH